VAAIRINRSVADGIQAHGTQDYPAECCGLVTEDPTGRQQVRPCRNIQDALHRRDPQAHPRTSRNAYRMDDVEVQKALREAESVGERLAAFYHSHIDCDAYFSAEDQTAALFADEPAFPGVSYLVFSVREGRVAGQAAYRYDNAARAFIRVPLILED
jgi:proteasome lid subunit RPN8/RPN11